MNFEFESYLQLESDLRSLTSKRQRASLFIEESDALSARFTSGSYDDFALRNRRGSALRLYDNAGSFRQDSVDTASPYALRKLLRGEPKVTGSECYTKDVHLDTVSVQSLIDEAEQFCLRIDAAAREVSNRVRNVLIDVELVRRRIGLVSPEASNFANQELQYFTVRTVAQDGSEVTTGFYTPGTSASLETLDPSLIGRTSAQRAIDGLGARSAPLASLPVVVSPGRGMVLIHEACCHPLEGDEVLKGSIYAGGKGRVIGQSDLSITDDPTIPGAVGSYEWDDEGSMGEPTRLVESGRIRNFLTDNRTALIMGDKHSTANARVENYTHEPLPRMTNTVVGPGKWDPDEIIAQTKFGIYAENVGGGQVEESTGEFIFRVLNPRMIENGQLGDYLKETSISGVGNTVLGGIDMIGTDVTLGAAKCGKRGQLVPVGVMGPTLRINQLRVGGTSN